MDNAHRTVFTIDATEKWKSNGMVTTKSNDSWESFTLLRYARLVCICCRWSWENTMMTFFDLVDCVCIVVPLYVSQKQIESYLRKYVRGDGYVSTINYWCPTVKRICIQWDIIPACKEISIVCPLFQVRIFLPLNPTLREPIVHKQTSKLESFYKFVRTRDWDVENLVLCHLVQIELQVDKRYQYQMEHLSRQYVVISLTMY